MSRVCGKVFRIQSLKYALVLALSMSLLLSPGNGWAIARRPPDDAENTPKPLENWKYTLGDCYRLALRRMETIGMREEDIQFAIAQYFKATSEALGDIDFEMTHFYQDAPKPGTQSGDGSGGGSLAGTFAARARRQRNFTVSQPLFQGFKSVGAILGAGSYKKQKVEDKVRTQQVLFLEVASAFYWVLKQREEVKINEGIIELFRKRINELNEREKVGRSRQSEVVFAEASIKTIEADLAESKGRLASSLYLLEFLTGVPISPDYIVDDNDVTGNARTLEEYLTVSRTRPDVLAFESAVKTAFQGIVVAQSDLWPNLTWDYNQYEKREGFQSGFDWDMTFTADVPLFRGGETVGKIKEAWSVWKKAKLEYSLIKRQAELQVKQSYSDWQYSAEQYKALEEAVQASEENYWLQEQDYSRSLVSNLDVLQALEALHSNRRAANRVCYVKKENYRRLQVAIGEVPGDVP